MKPLLSIVIPTYNREPFLDKSLEILLAQCTDEVEIAISNDGSKDNTDAIVKKYQDRFPGRITYYKKPVNERFDKNLITGIDIAHGEYCWFLSDDDMLVPGAVAKVLEELKKNNERKFILLNYSRYENATQSVSFARMMEFESRMFSVEEFMSTLSPRSYFPFLGMNIIYMSVFIFPRELWQKHIEYCKRFIGTNFIHCFVFLRMLAKENLSITYLGTPYVLYRSGNIRDWGTNIWRDFHMKFLGEALDLGIATKTVRKMRRVYFFKKTYIRIGSSIKGLLRTLHLIPQK